MSEVCMRVAEGERSQGWERRRWRGSRGELAGLHLRGIRVEGKTSARRGGELAGCHVVAAMENGARGEKQENRMPTIFSLLCLNIKAS